MRVAHLLRKYDPSEWGGTESAMQQLTGGLRREGVESVVYAPAVADRGARDPLSEGGNRVVRFRAFVPIVGISEHRRRQLVAVGGNLMSFHLIRLLIREPGLAVVHTHALGRVGAIGWLAARRRGLPFIVTIHGGLYDLPAAARQGLAPAGAGGWEWGKPFGMILRSRRLLSGADAILTCNPREAEMIQERHPGARVMVHPHGVAAARYRADHRDAAARAFPELAGRPYLLVVGRIDPVKNQGWLVRQWPQVRARHPDLRLVLAGACTDEAYGQALRTQAARHGPASAILMPGPLPPADGRLIGLMQSAEAVVLPSVSETFGLVILEAWAAGVPVLASQTSGARSLIEHGHSGWLFDLEQPGEFHRGLDAIATRPDLRSGMIAAGRRRVASDFDSDVLAGRMRRLYAKAIEKRHAHRPAAR